MSISNNNEMNLNILHSNSNLESSYFEAFLKLISDFEYNLQDRSEIRNLKIKKYNHLINRNSGMTIHYQLHRLHRENELRRLLGTGKHIDSFVVEGLEKLQIHEIFDNAVIIVYDYVTHKKITIFAPHPCRLISLYESVGEIPPLLLVERSKNNLSLGYNRIHSLAY